MRKNKYYFFEFTIQGVQNCKDISASASNTFHYGNTGCLEKKILNYFNRFYILKISSFFLRDTSQKPALLGFFHMTSSLSTLVSFNNLAQLKITNFRVQIEKRSYFLIFYLLIFKVLSRLSVNL